MAASHLPGAVLAGSMPPVAATGFPVMSEGDQSDIESFIADLEPGAVPVCPGHSERFSPNARTLSFTHPALGAGDGTSSSESFSGPPASRMTQAFMRAPSCRFVAYPGAETSHYQALWRRAQRRRLRDVPPANPPRFVRVEDASRTAPAAAPPPSETNHHQPQHAAGRSRGPPGKPATAAAASELSRRSRRLRVSLAGRRRHRQTGRLRGALR